MRLIDRERLIPLHAYIIQCIESKVPIRVIDLCSVGSGERALATCLRVILEYKDRPKLLSLQNLDLWWSVVICGNDDYNAGSPYGYSSKTSVRICNSISEYVIWFLLHLNKEVMESQSSLRVISALVSRGIFSRTQAVSVFKEAQSSSDIDFLSKDDWVGILYCNGITSLTSVRKQVDDKFRPKGKRVKQKSKPIETKRPSVKVQGVLVCR